jgi:hypothetical protein
MGRFLDDYVKVNERIQQFREKYPEGFISTYKTDVNDDVVDFRALVYRSAEEAGLSIAASTGHSRTFIDPKEPEKCIEKGETVAIGRALGILGFEITKSIATAEEVDKAKATSSRFGTKKKAATKKTTETKTTEEEVEEVETKLKTNKKFKAGSRFQRATK